jgi:hypothetical protein
MSTLDSLSATAADAADEAGVGFAATPVSCGAASGDAPSDAVLEARRALRGITREDEAAVVDPAAPKAIHLSATASAALQQNSLASGGSGRPTTLSYFERLMSLKVLATTEVDAESAVRRRDAISSELLTARPELDTEPTP